MTIRAKLLAAIALTVLGPLVTIGVALAAFGTLGDRFDDVQDAGDRQALALELKFAVTDMNGWQTAYGYDRRAQPADVRGSRRSAREALLATLAKQLRAPRERRCSTSSGRPSTRSWSSTPRPSAALQAGRHAAVRRILLGPEIEHFQAMASAADGSPSSEDRRAAAAAARVRRGARRRAARARRRRDRRGRGHRAAADHGAGRRAARPGAPRGRDPRRHPHGRPAARRGAGGARAGGRCCGYPRSCC